jgi:hypothetical protein
MIVPSVTSGVEKKRDRVLLVLPNDFLSPPALLVLSSFPSPSLPCFTMAPLADFILANVPLPTLPDYLTSYVQGQTPLSTTKEVAPALVSYLAVIFSIQAIMKNQQPLRLQFFFQLHNVILSSGSLLLLALMVEEIAPIVWKNGLFYGMCNEASWTSVRVFRVHFTSYRTTDLSYSGWSSII